MGSFTENNHTLTALKVFYKKPAITIQWRK